MLFGTNPPITTFFENWQNIFSKFNTHSADVKHDAIEDVIFDSNIVHSFLYVMLKHY